MTEINFDRHFIKKNMEIKKLIIIKLQKHQIASHLFLTHFQLLT